MKAILHVSMLLAAVIRAAPPDETALSPPLVITKNLLNSGETTWSEYWKTKDEPSRIHTCYSGIGGNFIKAVDSDDGR
jgi:hypothetical protein